MASGGRGGGHGVSPMGAANDGSMATSASPAAAEPSDVAYAASGGVHGESGGRGIGGGVASVGDSRRGAWRVGGVGAVGGGGGGALSITAAVAGDDMDSEEEGGDGGDGADTAEISRSSGRLPSRAHITTRAAATTHGPGGVASSAAAAARGDAGRNGRPLAQFIASMFKMLSSATHGEYIAWSDDGSSFIVKDIDAFAKIVLPQYFRHSNFSSMARQLNFYDFRKLSKAHSTSVKMVEYAHPYFLRGRADLLPLVVRKTNNTARMNLEEIGVKASFGSAPPPASITEQLAVTVAGRNAVRGAHELEAEIGTDGDSSDTSGRAAVASTLASLAHASASGYGGSFAGYSAEGDSDGGGRARHAASSGMVEGDDEDDDEAATTIAIGRRSTAGGGAGRGGFGRRGGAPAMPPSFLSTYGGPLGPLAPATAVIMRHGRTMATGVAPHLNPLTSTFDSSSGSAGQGGFPLHALQRSGPTASSGGGVGRAAAVPQQQLSALVAEYPVHGSGSEEGADAMVAMGGGGDGEPQLVFRTGRKGAGAGWSRAQPPGDTVMRGAPAGFYGDGSSSEDDGSPSVTAAATPLAAARLAAGMPAIATSAMPHVVVLPAAARLAAPGVGSPIMVRLSSGAAPSPAPTAQPRMLAPPAVAPAPEPSDDDTAAAGGGGGATAAAAAVSDEPVEGGSGEPIPVDEAAMSAALPAAASLLPPPPMAPPLDAAQLAALALAMPQLPLPPGLGMLYPQPMAMTTPSQLSRVSGAHPGHPQAMMQLLVGQGTVSQGGLKPMSAPSRHGHSGSGGGMQHSPTSSASSMSSGGVGVLRGVRRGGGSGTRLAGPRLGGGTTSSEESGGSDAAADREISRLTSAVGRLADQHSVTQQDLLLVLNALRGVATANPSALQTLGVAPADLLAATAAVADPSPATVPSRSTAVSLSTATPASTHTTPSETSSSGTSLSSARHGSDTATIGSPGTATSTLVTHLQAVRLHSQLQPQGQGSTGAVGAAAADVGGELTSPMGRMATLGLARGSGAIGRGGFASSAFVTRANLLSATDTRIPSPHSGGTAPTPLSADYNRFAGHGVAAAPRGSGGGSTGSGLSGGRGTASPLGIAAPAGAAAPRPRHDIISIAPDGTTIVTPTSGGGGGGTAGARKRPHREVSGSDEAPAWPAQGGAHAAYGVHGGAGLAGDSRRGGGERAAWSGGAAPGSGTYRSQLAGGMMQGGTAQPAPGAAWPYMYPTGTAAHSGGGGAADRREGRLGELPLSADVDDGTGDGDGAPATLSGLPADSSLAGASTSDSDAGGPGERAPKRARVEGDGSGGSGSGSASGPPRSHLWYSHPHSSAADADLMDVAADAAPAGVGAAAGLVAAGGSGGEPQSPPQPPGSLMHLTVDTAPTTTTQLPTQLAAPAAAAAGGATAAPSLPPLPGNGRWRSEGAGVRRGAAGGDGPVATNAIPVVSAAQALEGGADAVAVASPSSWHVPSGYGVVLPAANAGVALPATAAMAMSSERVGHVVPLAAVGTAAAAPVVPGLPATYMLDALSLVAAPESAVDAAFIFASDPTMPSPLHAYGLSRVARAGPATAAPATSLAGAVLVAGVPDSAGRIRFASITEPTGAADMEISPLLVHRPLVGPHNGMGGAVARPPPSSAPPPASGSGPASF